MCYFFSLFIWHFIFEGSVCQVINIDFCICIYVYVFMAAAVVKRKINKDWKQSVHTQKTSTNLFHFHGQFNVSKSISKNKSHFLFL